MSHIREPFKIRVHRKLMDEINEMSIRIKVHHFNISEMKEKPEAFIKLKEAHPCPSWEQVENLLWRCLAALDEQKVDPRKY